jgi:hypothetical protein
VYAARWVESAAKNKEILCEFPPIQSKQPSTNDNLTKRVESITIKGQSAEVPTPATKLESVEGLLDRYQTVLSTAADLAVKLKELQASRECMSECMLAAKRVLELNVR